MQTKAVARGDLSKTVNADVQGEILDLKCTVNEMVSTDYRNLQTQKLTNVPCKVAQLTVFAAEVTRVSLEVGTEGKLGGQAVVPNVEGTWMVLTDNVNLMVWLFHWHYVMILISYAHIGPKLDYSSAFRC